VCHWQSPAKLTFAAAARNEWPKNDAEHGTLTLVSGMFYVEQVAGEFSDAL